MSEETKIFEEHGGVLQSIFGKATITYFGHQIRLCEHEVKIFPSNVSIVVSPEEKQLFKEYSKPATPKQLYGKVKSAMHELAELRCDPEEKREILKRLKAELNAVAKGIK